MIMYCLMVRLALTEWVYPRDQVKEDLMVAISPEHITFSNLYCFTLDMMWWRVLGWGAEDGRLMWRISLCWHLRLDLLGCGLKILDKAGPSSLWLVSSGFQTLQNLPSEAGPQMKSTNCRPSVLVRGETNGVRDILSLFQSNYQDGDWAADIIKSQPRLDSSTTRIFNIFQTFSPSCTAIKGCPSIVCSRSR